MELTAENVHKVAKECLFDRGENTDNAVIVEGVMLKYGFHPERLKNRAPDIREMLNQLPATFRQSVGGGWSFLNACMREDGFHWAEHRDIEILLVLGLSLGMVKWATPRSMWDSMPGGMPYVIVLDEKEAVKS